LSNAVALETDKPPGAGLNWRHRKRRKALIDGYVHALGGIERVNALQRVEIDRCVDMTLLAEAMRGRALRGEAIDIGDLTRLEGAVSRVIRSLNLPAPGTAAPPAQAWQDFLASHQPAATNEGDG
jgi:hypothetical protein